MKLINSTKALLVVVALFTTLVFACASSEKDPAKVPADLTSAKLFQSAQDAIRNEDYESANMYFNLIKNRFPNDDVIVLEANYNLAMVATKKERWDVALSGFKGVVAAYDNPEKKAKLPPQFLALSKKLIEDVSEKLKKQAKAPAPTASASPSSAPVASFAPTVAPTESPATPTPESSASPAAH